MDAGAQEATRSGSDDYEEDDDFLSVASVADEPVDESVDETEDGGADESTSGRYVRNLKVSDSEDRVAVVDRKIRELRKMLGVRDKQGKQGKPGKKGNQSVLDDLSHQLDFIIDRVSEILADETVEQGSSPAPKGRRAKARCCC